MMRLLFYYLLPAGFCFVILYMSCANPVAPTGGLKDEQAPGIDSLRSSINLTTTFTEDKIELTFDEWIVLNDPYNQIVISPPLEYRPKIKLKKKTVVIEWDEKEVLKENTTYIVNFGNSIKDFREGNIPENMKYVFSTGSSIDSLSARGAVLDIETGKAMKDVLVMFYDNLEDSIVRKEKPYYFAKTDNNGAFEMEYIKGGTYKVFALVDNNYNYLFDLPNEQIGFMEEPVVINDSSNVILSLRIFEEDQPIRILDKELKQQGLAKIVFSEAPRNLQVGLSDNFSEDYHYSIVKDSLLFWYKDTSTIEERSIYLNIPNTDFSDTVSFNIPRKKKELFPQMTSRKSIILSPKDSLILEFNQPISNVDLNLITIEKDSLVIPTKPLFNIMNDPRKVYLDFESEENGKYLFNILPNAFENIYGNSIKDTIELKVSTPDLTSFGDLKLNVVVPDSTIAYIFRLENSRGEQLDEQHFSSVSSYQKEYKTLGPGKYSVIIIEDSNGNKRRDSGSYDEQRQPERIFKKQLEDLRKNWELEAEVQVTF